MSTNSPTAEQSVLASLFSNKKGSCALHSKRAHAPHRVIATPSSCAPCIISLHSTPPSKIERHVPAVKRASAASAAACECALKARNKGVLEVHWWNEHTAAALNRCIAHLHRCERLQPRASPAHGGISTTRPHTRITCRARQTRSGGFQRRVVVALALHVAVQQRNAEGGVHRVAALIVSFGSALPEPTASEQLRLQVVPGRRVTRAYLNLAPIEQRCMRIVSRRDTGFTTDGARLSCVGQAGDGCRVRVVNAFEPRHCPRSAPSRAFFFASAVSLHLGLVAEKEGSGEDTPTTWGAKREAANGGSNCTENQFQLTTPSTPHPMRYNVTAFRRAFHGKAAVSCEHLFYWIAVGIGGWRLWCTGAHLGQKCSPLSTGFVQRCVTTAVGHY